MAVLLDISEGVVTEARTEPVLVGTVVVVVVVVMEGASIHAAAAAAAVVLLLSPNTSCHLCSARQSWPGSLDVLWQCCQWFSTGSNTCQERASGDGSGGGRSMLGRISVRL